MSSYCWCYVLTYVEPVQVYYLSQQQCQTPTAQHPLLPLLRPPCGFVHLFLFRSLDLCVSNAACPVGVGRCSVSVFSINERTVAFALSSRLDQLLLLFFSLLL